MGQLVSKNYLPTKIFLLLYQHQLGWHYRIRIKSNTWIWRGNWCQPKNFHLHRGQAICLHNVRIHKGEYYGIVHVIIGRNSVNGELWAIVSDEQTTLQTFAEYGLRFDLLEICDQGLKMMEGLISRGDCPNWIIKLLIDLFGRHAIL